MSRILVTGAGGMLGRDVMRAADSRSVDASGLTRSQLDITDPDSVAAAVASVDPDVIINCAAWTDVDGAEEREPEALEVNGNGPGILAKSGPRVVHVSTDYVFDGIKPGPYFEADATGPRSAYGRTKLAGERAVAEAGGHHSIVRTAWLFGTGGNNFVETMLRLAADRGAVSVVDDQHGCPTNTAHLAQALVTLALAPDSGGIHHCAGSGETTWFGFAGEIFRLTATECELTPTDSAAFVRPAPRPANSVLASSRGDTPVLADWKTGLSDYISARASMGDER